ncbi:MAG: undecaprenyl-diphosphate phosphatase [Helicobacter sp.]|nr:undecaprenyl-diphosphate phosphatase [Helicobacter sp.]
MDILSAVILGIIEGLTEFLPISSTGHLILAANFLGLTNNDFLKTFEISIQFGSILAVVFIMKKELFNLTTAKKETLNLWLKLAISFVPTGIIGFFAYSYIKSLFNIYVVSVMLIIGGIAFLALEFWFKKSKKPFKKMHLNDITFKDAFLIGLSQSLAMIPGTSRSGSTIFCALLLGFSRKLSAEFSFFLAIPTMFTATAYSIYKSIDLLHLANLHILLIGGIVAFFTALLAIKLFLAIVQKFSYSAFGIYRICLGLIILTQIA